MGGAANAAVRRGAVGGGGGGARGGRAARGCAAARLPVCGGRSRAAGLATELWRRPQQQPRSAAIERSRGNAGKAASGTRAPEGAAAVGCAERKTTPPLLLAGGRGDRELIRRPWQLRQRRELSIRVVRGGDLMRATGAGRGGAGRRAAWSWARSEASVFRVSPTSFARICKRGRRRLREARGEFSSILFSRHGDALRAGRRRRFALRFPRLSLRAAALDRSAYFSGPSAPAPTLRRPRAELGGVQTAKMAGDGRERAISPSRPSPAAGGLPAVPAPCPLARRVAPRAPRRPDSAAHGRSRRPALRVSSGRDRLAKAPAAGPVGAAHSPEVSAVPLFEHLFPTAASPPTTRTNARTAGASVRPAAGVSVEPCAARATSAARVPRVRRAPRRVVTHAGRVGPAEEGGGGGAAGRGKGGGGAGGRGGGGGRLRGGGGGLLEAVCPSGRSARGRLAPAGSRDGRANLAGPRPHAVRKPKTQRETQTFFSATACPSPTRSRARGADQSPVSQRAVRRCLSPVPPSWLPRSPAPRRARELRGGAARAAASGRTRGPMMELRLPHVHLKRCGLDARALRPRKPSRGQPYAAALAAAPQAGAARGPGRGGRGSGRAAWTPGRGFPRLRHHITRRAETPATVFASGFRRPLSRPVSISLLAPPFSPTDRGLATRRTRSRASPPFPSPCSPSRRAAHPRCTFPLPPSRSCADRRARDGFRRAPLRALDAGSPPCRRFAGRGLRRSRLARAPPPQVVARREHQHVHPRGAIRALDASRRGAARRSA